MNINDTLHTDASYENTFSAIHQIKTKKGLMDHYLHVKLPRTKEHQRTQNSRLI